MAERKNTAKAAKAEEAKVDEVVEEKTDDNLDEVADGDTFSKEYLVYVDDSAKFPDYHIDRNKKDVEASALQRGLKATGEAELESKEVVDKHNVRLVYTLPVELNTDETK